MTIELTNSAGGDKLTLVHGPGQATATYAQGPMGPTLTFNGAQHPQVTPLTRSEFSQVLPRRNHQATLPFAALRCFGTLAAARGFAAMHSLAVQALPRLVIVEGAARVTLHGAMTICTAVVKGVAVELRYEFTYGKVEEVSA